ncbi:MAG: DNA recombination protein RmuC [Cucumibacter sp.]
MDQIVWTGLGHDFTGFEAGLIGAGLLAVLVLTIVAIVLSRAGRGRAAIEAMRAAEQAMALEQRLAQLMQVQSEMTGRIQSLSEIFGARTSDLARVLSETIDNSSQRMGQSLAETRTKTEESLGKLNERLAVIDSAQTTITRLSTEVVDLQKILSNKQQRGAFGQGRMEAIIGDALAAGAYQFQVTLSNGKRPDCVVKLPNGAPPLVIDAKFPLESWQLIEASQSPDDLARASTQFRNDIGVHVKAIAGNYLLPGETHDVAFMFVPSESIFADLHEKFDDVVQKASRARVMIVSPSLLMLSVQVVQALMRDVEMRKQAHRIQHEVTMILEDVRRLGERVDLLRTHFRAADRDIEQIETTAAKITGRGGRIGQLEFEAAPARLAAAD